MESKGRSGRVVMPLAGSAVVVVAGGALAPAVHAAPAAPETDTGLSSLGGVQELGSCEAFFGFGKELVAFDVVDQNGADGVAHEVPTDTQVIFVLEDEDGDQLECLPEEVTEAEWDDFWGPGFPVAFPGPDHFIYPSVELGENVDEGDFGTVDSVSFRVGTIPAGHTLVSPTGTVELDQSQLQPEPLLFLDEIDPRVLAFLEAEVGAAAADAYEAAVVACNDNSGTALSGDDLQDAVDALDDLTANDSGSPSCSDIGELNLDGSIVLGVEQSIDYTETITLALPQGPTTTTTTVLATTSTTAAVSPTTVARVLARTGASRSSVPVALVGFASIAGGLVVLGARRRFGATR